jgi:hypothetical protein
MTTRRRIHSTLPIRRAGFQHCIHEKKNTGKIRVCIAFYNLNKATRKDEYLMPIANMFINNAFGHQVISF